VIEFYASHKLAVWATAILLSMAGCLFYYAAFGPHAVSVHETGPGVLVRRFGVREWVCHWLMLLGFLALAGTGLAQLVPGPGLGHWGPFHGRSGLIFFLVALATLLGWIPDALFKPNDWPWLLKMGGYFSRDAEPPAAGRFNAGQKVYYWALLLVLTGLLVSAVVMEHGPHSPAGRKELFWCLHGLLGCLATMMVIVHAFLSLFVNPRAARVVRDGRVSRRYVEKYHSLWRAQG
jgi:formate dehydrogenase subunit gamma